MPTQPGAVLIAEIGSITTRLTLVDIVDTEFRLVARAEVLSTVDLPHQDAMVAVLEGVAQIEEQTSRRLLKNDGTLLIPQTAEQDGVDRFVAITSATDLLSLVIAAVASDVSARSALHGSRCTYTSILQVVTLDDAPPQQLDSSDRSWIERQVQTLLGIQPDVVILAGGLEGGAKDAIKRLAHIVGLTAMRPHVDSVGQQRQEVIARPVIFAGNSSAREQVLAALDGRCQPVVVDNVRPTLEQENLDPLRRSLTKLYEELVLAKQSGLGPLRRTSGVPLTTVCAAQGVMTRFLGEQYGRQVLTLDVGATHSGAYLYSQGRYSPAVLGNCGLGFGLSSVLNERGPAAIAAWLPFPIGEQELTHRLLNKLVRPHLPPVSREDLWIELACTREIVSMLLQRLRDERPDMRYDMVILSGSAFAHAAHGGMALLAALDALHPYAEAVSFAEDADGAASGLLLDVYVDSLGLLAAAGAIAPLHADAAVTICERDLLRNTPLAKCLVVRGEGHVGDVALEAELTPIRGKPQHISVRHGEIGRLRLDQGMKGQLTLRPAPGVRVGANTPGVEISSDMGAIDGSAVGVVIDARGPLPSDETQRRTHMWQWLTALGAVRGANPYLASAESEPPVVPAPVLAAVEALAPTPPVAREETSSAPALPVPPPDSAPAPVTSAEIVAPAEALPPQRGKRISLDELAQQEAQTRKTSDEPAASAPRNLENDLAQLRQSVEVPKRRGLFGRKK